ncbi:hypothetical protein [Clostridium akagii]|uniref:hypothetical protein n=1 Tax=Clostridium akagii TaxID=91623 RepID=UPI00047BC678|nr:hypothetical protein [Clostridium akagii]
MFSHLENKVAVITGVFYTSKAAIPYLKKQGGGKIITISVGSEWIKEPEDVTNLALFIANKPLVGPTGQSFSLMRRDL